MTSRTVARSMSARARATGAARWVPRLTLGVAAAHLAVAALAFRPEWSGILADGLWDSVADDDADRVAALWFAVGGVGLAGLGLLARRSVRTTGAIPPELGGVLIALGLPIAALQPVSGGWVLIALGVAALVTTRRNHEELDS